MLEFKRDDPEAEKSKKCFGFVQTYDGKPRRRLFELLKSQGMAMNQQVTFLSDGGDDVRQIQQYLNPEAEYWLDWFPITMGITGMKQMAKGLAHEQQAAAETSNPQAEAPEKSRLLDCLIRSVQDCANNWALSPDCGSNSHVTLVN